MQNYNNILLVAKCIDKDPLAWREFTRRFSPLISFSIHRALKKYITTYNSADLEDIKQEVFTALWAKGKLQDIRDRDKIGYWLSSVSLNTAISYLRSKNREILFGDLSGFENIPDVKSRHPLYNLLKHDKIKQLLSTLNTKEKLVFKLRVEKEIKDAEIAQILKMPRNSVTKMVSRIRKKLKNLS